MRNGQPVHRCYDALNCLHIGPCANRSESYAAGMIRTCAACSKQNRIPTKHLASVGKCGACQAVLPATAVPMAVDESQFRDIVAHATVPVLVDFWAAWCGPCRMAAPELETVAKQMAGKSLVIKVNTEEQQNLAREYNVSSIPFFMVFKNGRAVKQQAGLVKAAEMQRWLAI